MWTRKTAVPAAKPTDSLIGHGGTLEGKILCDTNLRIEGGFSGEIDCKGTVTIGEQGTVRSSIKAQNIVIAGKVYGDVNAGQRLTMTGTGQLHGNVLTGTLSIMEGGILNGSVAMNEQQPVTETASGLLQAGEAGDKASKRGGKMVGAQSENAV